MFQYLKDLSIRVKISGFVIPSTIAFGIVMTCLSLFLLNDFKNTAIIDFENAVEQIQAEAKQNSSNLKIAEVLETISSKADDKINDIMILLISIVGAVIILATIGALIISNLIGQPVKKVALGLENISSGDADLTQRLTVTASDETGMVSQFFNTFLAKLQEIIKNMKSNADKLSGATKSIHTLILTIQEKATSAQTISQTVFRSAGYMSKDMSDITVTLDESTENIHLVSAAIEELTSTVTEISETSGKAHRNTEKAKEKMDLLEKEVHELGQAGEDISKVTETIAEISEQVNLLALNATIEAARAGEAGKGFAVVANEIKELAHQTAKAATEIQTRIDQVQSVTKATITGIVEATEIVSQNTDIVATIASAVEEQSATAAEIAQSLSTASEKLEYSNNKVSKAAEHAENIAEMANDVTNATIEVDDAVISIIKTSESLQELADDSAKVIKQFRT